MNTSHISDCLPTIASLEEARHCETHGNYVAVRRPSGTFSSCPQCMKAQIKRESDQHQRDLMALARTGRALEVPIRYRMADVTHLDEAVRERFSEWVATMQGSLILLGAIGTGKTYAACAAMHEAQKAGKSSVYTTFQRYVRSIRDSWDDGEKRTSDVFRTYTFAPLLVMDEVMESTERNARDTQLLQELIGERNAAMLPTIYVSNLAAEALREALGPRAYSRIRENATRITFRGEDRRSPKGEGT